MFRHHLGLVFLFLMALILTSCNDKKNVMTLEHVADSEKISAGKTESLTPPKNISSSRGSRMLAKVNEEAITKRDLEMYIKIHAKNYPGGGSEANYQKALLDYITLLEKSIVAKKIGITLDKKEDRTCWNAFSSQMDTKKDLQSFCKDNKIDENFVKSLVDKNCLWQKYINEVLRRGITMNEQMVTEYAEYKDRKNIRTRYNVAEIMINFSNVDRKNEALSTLEDIRIKIVDNKLSFEKAAKSFSQSSSAADGGKTGWVDDSTHSKLFLDNLKTLKKGELSPVFCLGNTAGACFLIRLDDRTKSVKLSNRQKMELANELGKNMMDGKERDAVLRSIDDIRVVYFR